MAATAQQIIDNAYAKSAASLPEQQASPTELVNRIGQCLREFGMLVAKRNPYLLGVVENISFGTTGWRRPGDCFRVLEVRTTAATVITPAPTVGSEITVVPWQDRVLATGVPALAELGQEFRPTGQAIDPTNGTIELTYCRSVVVPVNTSSTIDELFPEWAYDYLQFDLAAYLASKEERQADEQVFYGGKNAVLSQIVDWADTQTLSLTQRWPVLNPPITNVNGGRQPGTAGAQ